MMVTTSTAAANPVASTATFGMLFFFKFRVLIGFFKGPDTKTRESCVVM